MKLHFILKIAIIIAIFVLPFSNAPAALITYAYSGSWISNNTTDPQELGGAEFDLAFTIDSNTSPSSSSANSATYLGDASLVITGSPGDIDGVYARSDHSITINTDFNNFGYIGFGNFNSTPSSPISNTGGFIFFPLQRITFGVLSDTSLPIGDFTNDIQGVWSTGTAGGGSYSANITNLSSTVVPLPAAVWLFGSALVGMAVFRERHPG